MGGKAGMGMGMGGWMGMGGGTGALTRLLYEMDGINELSAGRNCGHAGISSVGSRFPA